MNERLEDMIRTETADEPATEPSTGKRVYGWLTRRRERAIEVSVFLFLIVQSMVFSLFAGTPGTVSFTLLALASIARDIALVALILFFLWRNQEPVSRIGWTKDNFWREAWLGLMLYIPFFLVVDYVQGVFQYLGLKAPDAPPPFMEFGANLPVLFLALVLVTVVAVTEETIFRGYLMLRLGSVTKSIPAAVVLSAVIFSLGHGYQGTLGLASVAVIGVLLALIYWWRRSIVAPAVIHFIQNFLSIIVVSLVRG